MDMIFRNQEIIITGLWLLIQGTRYHRGTLMKLDAEAIAVVSKLCAVPSGLMHHLASPWCGPGMAGTSALVVHPHLIIIKAYSRLLGLDVLLSSVICLGLTSWLARRSRPTGLTPTDAMEHSEHPVAFARLRVSLHNPKEGTVRFSSMLWAAPREKLPLNTEKDAADAIDVRAAYQAGKLTGMEAQDVFDQLLRTFRVAMQYKATSDADFVAALRSNARAHYVGFLVHHTSPCSLFQPFFLIFFTIPFLPRPLLPIA